MIFIVGGTRPNFIKMAPIMRELNRTSIKYMIVNTGQHYDSNMSESFFIKNPDISLNIGPGSQTLQTARIMEKFEGVCCKYKPQLVIVVGDVTTTLAVSLVVSKIPEIKLAHIEAGGRSFDKNMPEEINRIITDAVSDYLFAIEPDHVKNLLNEGIDNHKIFLVGDNIIDNLLYTVSQLPNKKCIEIYVLATIHRQSNTDNIENLKAVLEAMNILAQTIKVRFPIHPRTKNVIMENDLSYLLKGVQVMDPLGYKEFVDQLKCASVILTDSGGITIEAAVMQIPCVVVRDTLERQFLLDEGMSHLVSNNTFEIVKEVEYALDRTVKLDQKWSNLLDGKASERIVNILREELK